jgi:hypothetical protein
MEDLTNMKMAPRKERAETAAPSDVHQEEYPYGLRIHLDDEQLKKLGITSLPAVGTEVTLIAKAKVNNVHESTTDGGGGKHAYRSVGLQITDLGLKPPKSETKTEDVFYSKGEAG